MKFGKTLRDTVDNSYEDWRPMFMSYKDLKKCIAARAMDDLESKDSDSKDVDEDSDPDRVAARASESKAEKERNLQEVRSAERIHAQFFTKFKHEVDKVNEFFLDKQEDYIIEHAQLTAKVEEVLTPGSATRLEVNRLRQRLTNFHGELVLLENFSTVNYTGFRKILKKHDKKTGLNVRNVYLKTVLITPFFLSDTVRKLIRKTESQLSEMDNIRKFRRPISASALNLDAPGCSSPNSTPAQNSSKHASSSGTPPNIPPMPISVSPGTQVVMEPPRPHAFISPQSALWRLYSEARAYGNQMRVARQSTSTQKRIAAPPQSLVDLVDKVSATELGLEPSFLHAVSQASNYCIAGEETFSMGFFVLPEQTRLQVFKSYQGGAFICRNLRGRGRMQFYKSTNNGSVSTVPSEQGTSETPFERQDFCVEEERSAVTIGPWPSLTCYGEDMHMEWLAETECAIFYVCIPALVEECLPLFDILPLTPPRFRVLHDPEKKQRFVRILC